MIFRTSLLARRILTPYSKLASIATLKTTTTTNKAEFIISRKSLRNQSTIISGKVLLPITKRFYSSSSEKEKMSESKPLRFDNKVVVVTGAGGGLGRAYALAFAERGAKVVVNDLGGGMTGEGGKSSRAADIVVDEIKAKNGIAVANYDSVEDGEKIVQTALDNFGRIDILVNNAGILRDKSFTRTSDIDWDLIHRIHLRAAFLITRAAWPHMQKNKFGRIIMTSSGAGVYGNFGQANYSAAKLGLVGLSNTLAIEGKKYNIKCNSIAPVARSRLTQTVMPEDILESLKPEFVSPLVLFLSHEETEETGSLFEVGGGWIGKVRWQKSSGAVVKTSNSSMTPEDVRSKWNEITSFSNPIYHTSIGEATNHCLTASSGESSNDSSVGGDSKFKYEAKEAILYALSLGYSTKDADGLKFLYEGHADFSTLPMYGVIPAFSILYNIIPTFKLPDNLQLNPAKILHGEHYLEVFKPFKSADTLTLKASLVDVLDKGSGAVMVINIDLLDEKQERVALNQFVTFVVGSGNFGGKRESEKMIKVSTKKFDRKPDKTVEERTNIDQAALYRLNGDFNPLHIDPNISAVLGFDRPILHGLCTFGFAVKHIIAAYCDNDVNQFKSVKVRFAKPVLPGQTIQTNMWLDENERRVYFDCKVVETGSQVISGAYVELHSIKSTKGSNQTTSVSTPATSASGSEMAADKIFNEMSIKLKDNPELAKSINAVYAFQITKNNSTKIFLADLKQVKVTTVPSLDGIKADCTIIISDEDFVGLASGTANPQQMFMKGKLKIKGNIMLAQKLGTLFKANASSSTSTSSTPSAPKPSSSDMAADKIFDEMSIKLKDKPELAKSINAVYAFQITKNNATKIFLADLKQVKVTTVPSLDGIKADCTLIISDEDFVGLASGTANPQQMFMKGKLKIKGNIMLAQKLGTLFKTNSKL